LFAEGSLGVSKALFGDSKQGGSFGKDLTVEPAGESIQNEASEDTD
jgi:hypothetical protein